MIYRFLFWVVGGGKTAKKYLFAVVELGVGGWLVGPSDFIVNQSPNL